MYRHATKYLMDWKKKDNRKPMVIRGARQVGKTYLVRKFARECFDNMLEVNFEKDFEIATIFKSKNPRKIIQLLELQYNIHLKPGATLLFLDEIQAAPEILASLRYFYEEFPELHIISAGSLLEFALEEPIYSMPVGRIEYLFLGPMQFEEFLKAFGEDKLCNFLETYQINEDYSEMIHNRLMELFRIYLVTGGMPGPLSAYVKNESWQACEEEKNALLITFQDDFNKYGTKIKTQKLQLVFKKVPLVVGTKFKYVNISRDDKPNEIAKALDMLCLARVVHRIFHTSGTGVPLGATINDKKFKSLFLDVGIMSSISGLNLLDFEKAEDVILVNSGAICEQFIGQHLLFSKHLYQEPELHYWVREKKGASSEVDYLISEGPNIIPIEIKAGKTGSLKSLHMFIKEKKSSFGLKFCSSPPSMFDNETVIISGEQISYRLLSLPLYMVGQCRRLIREIR
ncbi:ATPase AAA [Candidatus Magnetomorum sp. HK-1]|nr:ATPase AAA [Candidatus Magnetomorum sp. HK-1]